MKKLISRRNFLKAAGVSAAALSLAACGGSSSSTASTASTAASTAAPSSNVELTYWSMWNATEGQAKVLAEAAEAYEAATGIHVNMEAAISATWSVPLWTPARRSICLIPTTC